MDQPGGRAPAPPSLALAQDLANTVDIEVGRDLLSELAGLRAFVTGHHLDGVVVRRADLATVVEFREALRASCRAHVGVPVAPDVASVLDTALSRAPMTLSIDAHGAARLARTTGLNGADAIVAEVASGIATAIGEGTWPRLKACVSEACRWVYYDHSPSGRSKWCTMSICGSRAKMRAYRRNRRISPT